MPVDRRDSREVGGDAREIEPWYVSSCDMVLLGCCGAESKQLITTHARAVSTKRSQRARAVSMVEVNER